MVSSFSDRWHSNVIKKTNFNSLFSSLFTGESAFSKSKTLPRGNIHIDETEGKQKVQNIMQLNEFNRLSIRNSLIKVVKSCQRKFAKSKDSRGIVLVFFASLTSFCEETKKSILMSHAIIIFPVN